MGSTGSGKLSDYSGGKPNGDAGKSSGSSDENKREIAFSTMPEEVDRSSFFTTKKRLPKLVNQ